MAENFVAEAVSASGAVFASHIRASDSAHFPLGKLVWGGDSATFNQTSTSSPFPVQLFGAGRSSSAPLWIKTDSGAPPLVAVSGYVAPSTTVTVTGYVAPSTTVTVTGYVAPSTTVTVANAPDTTVTVQGTVTVSNPTDSTVTAAITGNASVVNSSTAPLFVRGVGDSTVPVSGSVNAAISGNASVTIAAITTSVGGGALDSTNSAIRVNVVAGSAAGDSTVTAILNGGQSSVTVEGTVAVEPTSSAAIALNGRAALTGALVAQTLDLSSLAQTIMTASGRLYAISVSNPDTADNAWLKVYEDDSAGVTLGTNVAVISQMVPFGGGREMSWPVGVRMSSGMSVAAAATAPSTAHDTPAATLTLTAYYLPSS